MRQVVEGRRRACVHSALTVVVDVRNDHRTVAIFIGVVEICHGGAASKDSEPIVRHRVNALDQNEAGETTSIMVAPVCAMFVSAI